MSRKVRVGFGDSKGQLTKTILQEEYITIERINVKASIPRPKIYLKRLPQLDIGIYKNLISRKRNQMLLQSFIGIRQNNHEEELQTIIREAKRHANEKQDEINTLKFMASVEKMNSFISQTGANEAQARQYLEQYSGNVKEAIKVFNQRSVMINDIASRHNISLNEARDFLKANGYNLSLLD